MASQTNWSNMKNDIFSKHVIHAAFLISVVTAGIFMCADSHGAQPQIEESISVNELKNILRSDDLNAIVIAMNRVKQNQRSPELMRFILKLWREDGVPATGVMRSDIVRLELANVLVQANNNGFIKIDVEEIRKYAKEVIAGPNDDAKAIAIETLGLTRNADDIPLFKRIALEENSLTFVEAVLALNQSCEKRAKVALAEIKRRITREQNKKFLQDSIPDLANYTWRCPR
jgi:hypothetical protein